MRLYPIAVVAAVALSPSIGFAQTSPAEGAAGGAAAGAAVAGPVGAVAGGIVGGAVGTVGAILQPPPPEVREYVVHEEDVPSVRVEKRVVVGETLPDTVVLRPVPKYREYDYAVVNNERVIVEPKTRKIIEVIK